MADPQQQQAPTQPSFGLADGETEISDKKVWVGGLPYETRPEDMEKLVEGYGSVKAIDLKNKYAFIHFDVPADATRFVNDKHGSLFLNSQLTAQVTEIFEVSPLMTNLL